MAETQVTLGKTELQEIMAAMIKAAKEPTEAERVKMEKERAEFLRKEREAVELAKIQVQREEMRRLNCAHKTRFQGRDIHGWWGQVNSDGYVVPVCKHCQTPWPKFSAALLPDGGKNGVNFEEWNECNATILNEMHRRSFPDKCGDMKCFLCYPKKS